MHDIKDIRANPDKYRAMLGNRQDDPALIDRLLEADAEVQGARRAEDERLALRRQNGREIGRLVEEVRMLDRIIAANEKRIAEIDAQQQAFCEQFHETLGT